MEEENEGSEVPLRMEYAVILKFKGGNSASVDIILKARLEVRASVCSVLAGPVVSAGVQISVQLEVGR